MIGVNQYQAAFEAERWRAYPDVDAVEREAGYAVEADRLLEAARVLACPVKAHPPNWQHGRVLYAVTRRYLRGLSADVTPIGVYGAHHAPVTLLDIGTAKGFSALCLQWALVDSGVPGQVVSVDVIDPASHAQRNTVAECDGLKTLDEILAPWPEARAVTFLHRTGLHWLAETDGRIHVAFVDGKHQADVVRDEGRQIAARQQPGDLAVFDDVQIAGVAEAVTALSALYVLRQIQIHAARAYAIGVRR